MQDDVDDKVLEEDDYLERMGKIIKRDFFPEMKNLQEFKNRCNNNTNILIQIIGLSLSMIKRLMI